MLQYPGWLKPELIQIGPLAIRWYSLMYIAGYVWGYFAFRRRIRRGLFQIPETELESFITHLIVGMLIGARFFYVFIYNLPQYLDRPLEIFAIWQGGLSYHGAAVGMTIACYLFARKHQIPFYMVTDSMAYAAPIGSFLGRIGNFINAELYGRPTDSPFAMVFPTDPERLPRHPSQLYQSLTEGLLLYLILRGVQALAIKKDRLWPGLVGGSFLIGYGVLRFFVEYTRQPDPQLGLFFGGLLSMGQILCLIMSLIGVFVLWHSHRTQDYYEPLVKTEG